VNKFSSTAVISELADIETSNRGSAVEVADGCHIDAFVKIKMAGGSGSVIIGANTYINSGTVIYSGNGVLIGENVLIAANCSLAPVNHEFKSSGQLIVSQRFQPSRGGLIIEDDVWIGCNSVVLDGSFIRKGCVVAAGSVVRGELPPYSVSRGSPARIVGYRK
jgi:virginiamycin A acetyltransferase